MKIVAATTLLLSLAVPAIGKEHADQYQAGTFSSTGQFSDGSYAYCAGRSCSAYSAKHNVHYVRTDDGMFAIESPVSIAGTLLVGVLSNGIAPTLHKQWFMDQLHEGDQILFRASCNKHNNCTVWLPNPDHDGKEYETQAYFSPDVAKTNTRSFCGKGKLKPEVEARVCKVARPTAVAIAPISSATVMLPPRLQAPLAGPIAPPVAVVVPTTQPVLATPAVLSAATFATVRFESDPDGADIEIDGKFVGQTPSQIQVVTGDHVIRLTGEGLYAWQKQIHTDGGSTTISAKLRGLPPIYRSR